MKPIRRLDGWVWLIDPKYLCAIKAGQGGAKPAAVGYPLVKIYQKGMLYEKHECCLQVMEAYPGFLLFLTHT